MDKLFDMQGNPDPDIVVVAVQEMIELNSKNTMNKHHDVETRNRWIKQLKTNIKY